MVLLINETISFQQTRAIEENEMDERSVTPQSIKTMRSDDGVEA
jgi:hypothetical protein